MEDTHNMMTTANFIFFAAMVSAVSAPVTAQMKIAPTATELTGTWVLCTDPDHSPKDRLVFLKEGYGFDLRPNRPRYPFVFTEYQGKVMLIANAKGKLIPVKLRVDASNTHLYLKSDTTGHTSTYVREKDKPTSHCAVN